MSTFSGLNQYVRNFTDRGVSAFTRPATRRSKLTESDPLDPFLDDGFYRIVQLDSGGSTVDAAFSNHFWLVNQNECHVMMTETLRPAYRFWRLTRAWGFKNGFTIVPVSMPSGGNQNLELGGTAIAEDNRLKIKRSNCCPVWTIECAELSMYRESNGANKVIHYFRILEPGTNRCWKTNPESSVTIGERTLGRPPTSELYQLITGLPQQVVTISSNETVSASACDDNIVRRYYFGSKIPETESPPRCLSVQLETYAHNQGWAVFPNLPPCSWFEVAVFSVPPAEGALVQPGDIKKGADGASLTWLSHRVRIDSAYSVQTGLLFAEDHEIWRNVSDEDFIGVLACAQHGSWLCEARSGTLYFQQPLFEQSDS